MSGASVLSDETSMTPRFAFLWMTADALHIVTHPELYHDRAILRRLAWVVLMQERGGRVDQARLARMPVLGAA